MKIYLDNCCFNRPFDDQTQLKISLETQTKLQVQKEIREGRHSLVWSSILDYENSANPYEERRDLISKWRGLASQIVMAGQNPSITENARAFKEQGLHSKDALHCASAVYAGCDVLLTVDDRFLKVDASPMKIMTSITFISMEEEQEGIKDGRSEDSQK